MITPISFNDIGHWTYLIFAVINAIIVPVVYFFYPETAYRSLEEMDAIFGGANHVENAELSKGTVEQIEVATAETIVLESPKRNA